MSNDALADDLFADSPPQEPAQQYSPSIGHGSRSPDVKPELSPPVSPVQAEDRSDPQNLFGDDDEAPPTPRTDRDRTSTATPQTQASRTPHPLEYAEEDTPGEDKISVNLALPKWPKLKPTDHKIWHLKLPAYVNIESRPYDPDFYRAHLEDISIDGKAEPLLARSKMIGVRNTIRWKWVTGGDGEPLGSDLFDVAPSQGATLARPSDPQPATATGPTQQPEAPSSNSSTTFLCLAAPAEAVLVTESAVAGQLSLVPTSMTSKTHLELAKHVGQQHVKHSRMKILDEKQDPAKHNEMLFKSSGTKSKAPRSRTGGKSRQKRRMSDDSDHDRKRDFGDSSRAKRVDEGEYDEDDGFVVADSDDEGENTDEAAYGSTKTKRTKSKGRKRKGSEEPDEMEEAERRIEERERDRKRVKKESVTANQKKTRVYGDSEEDAEGEEEMEMDVESEDD